MKGIIEKQDNGFWIIEVPEVKAITQGHTRDDAFNMLKDYIECDIEEEIDMKIIDIDDYSFEIIVKNTDRISTWVRFRSSLIEIKQ